MNQPPSIFNDVIGPVMRGPSSSHTAASVRIGQLVRQCLKGNCTSFQADFDPQGSLATTYHGHGSDIGLIGGLLNMEATDPRLADALEIAAAAGIEVNFKIVEYPAPHPNTYRITASSDADEEIQLTFVSTGGGMIELVDIGELDVSIKGDFHETLLLFDSVDESCLDAHICAVEQLIPDLDYCVKTYTDGRGLINLKTTSSLPEQMLVRLSQLDKLADIITLTPVLPILSRKDCTVPFETAAEMAAMADGDEIQMWELAVQYESMRGNISQDQVLAMMEEIVSILKASVKTGLAGTTYDDRILGPQAHLIKKHSDRLVGGALIEEVIASVTAIMEVKSAMGVIVAAPTAGSCGGLPGTLIGVANSMGLPDEAIIKGMLAGGLIGVLISRHSTFAAEVCGCQAECGAGSGMAAAGLVQMMGGTTRESIDAAAIALQNILGMVCDPVADRVEVPCLGKNIMAGVNAIACANMALAGYDKVIPLDETIAAMDQVGRMLPPALRCTGHGGLSITETSRTIHSRINKSCS